MSDDETAGPSFLLAQHDLAHREHTRTHTDTDPDTDTQADTHTHTHTHTHAQAQKKESRHRHHQLHAKRDPATTQVVEEVVTQVTTTISFIQQIDVDVNGNTITVQTRLADSSNYPSLGILTDQNSPGSPGTTIASANPQITPTSAPPSSWQDTASIPTSTPLTTSSFSSFLATSNTTTLITSSSSFSKVSAFSNSTITSRTSSSIHRSSSKPSHSIFLSSTAASTTSTYTETSVEPVGGVNTALIGSQPSSTPVSTGGGNQTEVTPTPVVIGGVVGSVAGAAIIIIALLFIFRWRRRGNQMLSSRASGTGGDGTDIHEGPSSQPPGAGGMTERRSLGFALPAALAGLTGNKRQSQKTERTLSSTAGSERGFYRVSGRKLPSVLQSGGDGYGGEAPNEQTLSGSSFYRDSQGFYGGPGGLASPPPGVSVHPQQQQQQPDGGLPIMRPSPARTPVTEPGLGMGPGPFADSLHTPPQPPPPPRPDGLGRSHASQDGSHTSRFTEEV